MPSTSPVALITGSATGVGAAVALQLARRGHQVVVNYSRSADEAQASAAACTAAGAEVLCLQGDVAEDADCRALVQAAVDRWGRLDVLVNNAGITSFAGSANWDALDAGSSLAYIASKGGVNAMTLHWARVLAPEVRVNAVCPGLITTRWFVDGVGQEAYERLKAQYEASVPLGQASTAEDVAEAVVWLATGARTMTGELLLLDGGMHLGKAPTVVRSAT